MRILFIGDIVGKPGYTMICDHLNTIRSRHNVNVVIANAENSADGSGLTPKIYDKLIDAGVDGITLGDHIYRRKEIYSVLSSNSNIVKPANFPEEAPGQKLAIIGEAAGEQIAIVSLMGRVFMKPVDCPFQAADKILSQIPLAVRVILVDFHAEATSDKQPVSYTHLTLPTILLV